MKRTVKKVKRTVKNLEEIRELESINFEEE